MVRVSFAIYDSSTGNGILTPVACTLDGVNYSTVNGLAIIDGVSEGIHDYSIELPAGYLFLEGIDTMRNPLGVAGQINIEWLEGLPWPQPYEVNPFVLMLTLEPEGVFPPPDGNGISSKSMVLILVGVAVMGKALDWW